MDGSVPNAGGSTGIAAFVCPIFDDREMWANYQTYSFCCCTLTTAPNVRLRLPTHIGEVEEEREIVRYEFSLCNVHWKGRGCGIRGRGAGDEYFLLCSPNFLEVWVSGLNRRFAKPVTLERGSAGSNPAASARAKDVPISYGLGPGSRRFESCSPDKIDSLGG